jgi:hypothetical protein
MRLMRIESECVTTHTSVLATVLSPSSMCIRNLDINLLKEKKVSTCVSDEN